MSGSLVVVLALLAGAGVLVARGAEQHEVVTVDPDANVSTIPPGRLVTLLDGTDLVVQAPPDSGLDDLPLSLAGSLSWDSTGRSVYAYQLTYEQLTDAPPTTGRRTGGGQQVYVFDEAPTTAVSTPAPGASLYVVDFGSWVLLIHDLDDDPASGSVGEPGEVGLTDQEERRLLQGIDGVGLESGLRLEVSGLELGPTDSPDASLGEVELSQTGTPESLALGGRVNLTRRPCPAELDGEMTVDSGTIHCFLDGQLEVLVTGPTQAPLQQLEVLPATGATSFPAELLGATASTPAEEPPGTVVQIESDDELAEVWRSWGLGDDPPAMPDGHVVVGMVAQDGSCTQDIAGFVIAEDGLLPRWTTPTREPDEPLTTCLSYLAPSAYVVAVDAADLPADEVEVQVTQTYGGGQDGRQVLGSGTIAR